MIMSAWLDFGTVYTKFFDQDRAKVWNFSTRIYRVLAFYTNMRDSRGLLLIFLQVLPKRAPKIGILTKTVAFYLIFFMCWICCLVSSYIWDDILFKLHLKFLLFVLLFQHFFCGGKKRGIRRTIQGIIVVNEYFYFLSLIEWQEIKYQIHTYLITHKKK